MIVYVLCKSSMMKTTFRLYNSLNSSIFDLIEGLGETFFGVLQRLARGRFGTHVQHHRDDHALAALGHEFRVRLRFKLAAVLAHAARTGRSAWLDRRQRRAPVALPVVGHDDSPAPS